MKDIPMSRLEQAILIILYRTYPLPLSAEEIGEQIAREKLLEINEEDFDLWMENVIKYQEWIEKG